MVEGAVKKNLQDEPYFGFTSANPPISAGSFYCMLDVLVGLTVRGMGRC